MGPKTAGEIDEGLIVVEIKSFQREIQRIPGIMRQGGFRKRRDQGLRR